MATENQKRYTVLVSSTFSFTVCFMIWMMLAVVGIPIKQKLGLNETEFGFLAALPVLSGSLIRVPLGIWTDKFGGRIVMFILMLLSVPAIFAMQFATQYWQFLAIGLMMGLAGGSFSVGTPYVARWFPKEQQGLAMGIFGAGNAGSAVNKFLAPSLIAAGGWTLVPNVYAGIMLATAIAFWFFSYHDDKHLVSSKVSLKEQLLLLKDPGVLRYSQYYSVVFGGYVALALWMTNYYINEYGLSMKTAALLAACFSLPGGVLRAVGGYLSDKYGAYKVTWGVMWVLWVCFFLLSYPNTDFVIHGTKGDIALNIHLNVVLFTILMFTAGIAMAIGKASVFKFVANDYPSNIGAVSGAVGLAGGLGGFLLPIMFGALLDITGVRSTTFMLLYGCVCVSLIWMHFSMKSLKDQ
ncbi:NarK/NasA family nitrate transporter [Kingella negevensis]|uniref:Putative nitrate transporter NarT n=1 Tax=Kingella negevensis TaxID=1522312 RepID=A0A238TBY2_9NEIS|nr:nitrate/nitrite transporter [Kingella negevensis]MDK4680570.1 NarK/NasA family nitrate transporter [Kingella negevensis]MDK4681707.1 NarK/NasA family nitrate transporter [Kingella negevensis]MDK4685172.1 NarK/NasA family nitrate transporter [Kingella negevensis]MDK4689905.1 NarK/NasA family nitrate transporter [Kingella negevensis]MDK4692751.1 NarK/NasA family nitrate transporter [Kingella negevensis]